MSTITQKSKDIIWKFWKSKRKEQASSLTLQTEKNLETSKKEQNITNVNNTKNTSIGIINLSIQSNDLFGLGQLSNTLLILHESHVKFLSNQQEPLKWLIIIWEMVFLTIFLLYLSKFVILSLGLVDSVMRGIVSVVVILRKYQTGQEIPNHLINKPPKIISIR
ncbi:3137_t:CDS:2 [Entrophospora sp. SA101]|nr:3137_t:CDS:2 [Entrophospora sp. SA101]